MENIYKEFSSDMYAFDLRPHHLLCIQKFSGHGYSEEFTYHMTQVCSALSKNSNTSVTLTKGADELCSRCPFNSDGLCESEDKVDHMDKKVLEFTGYSYGDKKCWNELALAAKTRILDTDKFETICKSCNWFSLCIQTLK